MAIYDITLPLCPEQPPWPGDSPFQQQPKKAIDGDGYCNTSELTMASHFGTHMDAPYHFEPDGIPIDQVDPQILVGPCLVHAVDTPDLIKAEHLPDLAGVERIIFKTSNTHFIADTVFHTDYVSIGLSAAQALTQAGVRLVGLDYFSIEAYKAEGHPVHHELCGKGVILLEGPDLRAIKPGRYELIVLPLKIQNGDGSPVRAVLRDRD